MMRRPFKLPGPWQTLPLLFLLLLYFLPLYLVVVYYANFVFFFFLFLFLFKGSSKCGFSTLLSCSGFIICSLFASCILSEQIKMMRWWWWWSISQINYISQQHIHFTSCKYSAGNGMPAVTVGPPPCIFRARTVVTRTTTLGSRPE